MGFQIGPTVVCTCKLRQWWEVWEGWSVLREAVEEYDHRCIVHGKPRWSLVKLKDDSERERA